MNQISNSAALVPSSAIQRRLFVVGCPRAGTTLVQALLSGHPGVHTLPEHGLLANAFDGRGRRMPWTVAGLTLGRDHRALRRIVGHACQDRPQDAPPLPPRSFGLRRSAQASIATLDRIALSAGRRTWLEGVPRHVRHARMIEQLVPRGRIIHVVRDGRDVVASMCEQARVSGRTESRVHPRGAIAEWNRAVTAHRRHAGRPGHVHVFYEDLVAEPERELRRIAQECGIAFDGGMLAPLARGGEYESIGAPGRGDRRRSARTKFRELFDAAERRRIERALHLDCYGRLAESIKKRASYPGKSMSPRAESPVVAVAGE